MDVFHSIDDAAFFDPFDESVTGSVIGDGQSECVFTFSYFNLLRPSCVCVVVK